MIPEHAEVAEQFSEYIAGVVMSSQRVWESILRTPASAAAFTQLVSQRVPLPGGQIKRIVRAGRRGCSVVIRILRQTSWLAGSLSGCVQRALARCR